MLDSCISILKEVIEIIKKKKEIREATKLRISILLEEISKLIQDTANKLEKDEYPNFNCALMEKMSDHLHFHLIDSIPNEQLDNLHKHLLESSQVEKQYALRKEPETIPSLYNAAAEFKALSLLMKI